MRMQLGNTRPRVREIIPPNFKAAEKRKNAAYKEFINIFNQETSQIIADTPSDRNVTCPECSQEVPRGSFHREVPCPAKNEKLNKTTWLAKDFL